MIRLANFSTYLSIAYVSRGKLDTKAAPLQTTMHGTKSSDVCCGNPTHRAGRFHLDGKWLSNCGKRQEPGLTTSLAVPAVHSGLTTSLAVPAAHSGLTTSLAVPAAHSGLTTSLAVPAAHRGLTTSLAVPAAHNGLVCCLLLIVVCSAAGIQEVEVCSAACVAPMQPGVHACLHSFALPVL
uniref:Uncharacterized protein n=1 Tax=Timema poppense TaxID=170557 RepID=A0A7R9GVP3_TIMPO|nr:unnamed protein product [Timema poppensis]